MESKDIFKIVYDTRNLEVSLFWQRSNYFLVLNSGLALGYFNLKSTCYAILLSVIGIISSYLWFRVCLGSKYWQSRWEHRLNIIESYYREKGEIPKEKEFALFSADAETIRKDVEESLNKSKHKWLRSLIDKIVLSKPSVSFEMTKLSILFILGWVVLFITSI